MFLMAMTAWSQDLNYNIKGRLSNQDMGTNEGGVTIKIVHNGNVIATTQSSSNGKYAISASGPKTGKYELIYSKPGMVSKKIIFDLKNVYVEDLPAGNEVPIPPLDIDLFAERENVDFSFLENEPVASFFWDSKNFVLDFDRSASQKTKNKIQELLLEAEKEAAEQEMLYQKAIQDGDAAFEKEEYEKALEKFEEALTYKPKEPYPAAKIVELDALIQAQKEQELKNQQLETEYQNLIAAADNMRDNGNLEGAVSKYEEALTKKNEQYPKDQIAALKEQIAAKKIEEANNEKYNAVIKNADMFFKQKSLKAARDKYTEASKLKPSEEYPKKKLAEIDKMLEAQQEQEAKKKKYQQLVATADSLFNLENYEDAKANYEEALTYESSSTFVKGRIEICNQKIAEAKAAAELQEKIEELMSAGKSDMESEDYANAIAKFEEVLTLDAEHQEAKAQLALAQQKKAEQDAKAEELKEFNELVAAGDQAMTDTDFPLAIEKYEAALALNRDPEVNQKLLDAKTAKEKAEKAAAMKEEYDKLIEEGNALLIGGQLEESKSKFEAALDIDDTQQLPKDKIKEINGLIAERDAEADRQAKYEAAVKEADNLFDASKWNESLVKYEEAIKLQSNDVMDGGDSHPQERIAEIKTILAKEQEAADQKAKFEEAIAAADALFDKEDWKSSKDKYNEALTYDSGSTYAKDRIELINEKIAEAEANAEKLAQIEALLKDGQSLFDSEKYNDAKDKYNEVLALDPGNKKATDGLAAVNEKLAALKSAQQKQEEFDKLKAEGYELADNEKYDQAKVKLTEALSLIDDQEVKDKINEINAKLQELADAEKLEENYSKLMAEAQSLENRNDLNGAVDKYQEASDLKPSEQLPKDKIAELKGIIQANADQQQQEKDYNNAIAEGDELKSNNDYKGAIEAYKKAGNIKPTEQLPKDKIAEVERLIANEQAEQAEIDKQYNELMAQGDQLMESDKCLEAIDIFNQALALKPTEQAPVDKANEAKRCEQQKGEANKEYEKILTVAENKMNEGDFDRATELAKRAKTLKPDDPRPDQLIEEITRMRQIDEAYKELLKKGDDLAATKNYKEAITAYEGASAKKPEEQLPKDKIAEIKDRIAAEKNAELMNQLYAEYMAKGNDYQSKESYEQALSEFQNALSAKPGDLAAENKIKEIQQILDDLANKEAEEIGKKNAFNALIKKADNLFNEKKYMEAKQAYQQALSVDPLSTYAQQRIEECVRRAKDQGIDEAREQYNKIIAAADKNFNLKDWKKASDYYKRALNIMPTDPYPQKKLDEIDAILNPVVMNSADLEDLGDPFDNTVMDGEFILAKSEADLKLLKGNQLRTQYGNIHDAETEMTREKTADHYNTSNEIYKEHMKISRDAGEADLNQQAIAEALRKAESELQEDFRNDINYERNENISDQVMLDVVNKEVALEYGEDINVYAENTEIMTAYNTEQAIETSDRVKSDHNLNVTSDQKIKDVHREVSENTKDDVEEREEANQILIAKEKEISEMNNERGKSKHETLLQNKDQLRQIELNVEEKSAEDARIAGKNNTALVDVKERVNNTDREIIDDKEAHLQKTDQELADIKLMIRDDSEGRDENRKESTEIIKANNKALADAEYEYSKDEHEKYVTNKGAINEEVKTNGEINEKADEALAKKIEYVEMMDKKARVDYEADNKSDEEERLNVKKRIDHVYTDVESNTIEEKDKNEENAENLKDMTRTIDANNADRNIGEKEKHYETAEQIGDVDATPGPQSRVPNELGSEYPEGVSQENFTRKDQNGIVVAFITRRIVVREGHADVYIRTQTLHGITYTKNGQSSLQHVWNKETQDPSLERHY